VSGAPREAAFDVALVCTCVLLAETVAALWAPELLLSRQALVFGVRFGCAALFILRMQNPPRSIWATPASTRLSYDELVTASPFETITQRGRVTLHACCSTAHTRIEVSDSQMPNVRLGATPRGLALNNIIDQAGLKEGNGYRCEE
jgi:hypothetical protein